MQKNEHDPKGLIRESYNIDGIGMAECRSIFVDWALSLTGDSQAAIEALLAQYGAAHPGHPMTRTLTEGLAQAPQARRRGGRAARLN
jgi:hypothetical protein